MAYPVSGTSAMTRSAIRLTDRCLMCIHACLREGKPSAPNRFPDNGRLYKRARVSLETSSDSSGRSHVAATWSAQAPLGPERRHRRSRSNSGRAGIAPVFESGDSGSFGQSGQTADRSSLPPIRGQWRARIVLDQSDTLPATHLCSALKVFDFGVNILRWQHRHTNYPRSDTISIGYTASVLELPPAPEQRVAQQPQRHI